MQNGVNQIMTHLSKEIPTFTCIWWWWHECRWYDGTTAVCRWWKMSWFSGCRMQLITLIVWEVRRSCFCRPSRSIIHMCLVSCNVMITTISILLLPVILQGHVSVTFLTASKGCSPFHLPVLPTTLVASITILVQTALSKLLLAHGITCRSFRDNVWCTSAVKCPSTCTMSVSRAIMVISLFLLMTRRKAVIVVI